MQVAPPESVRHDADLLIEEARQHQRRRRSITAVVLVVLVVAAGVGLRLSHRPATATEPARAVRHARAGPASRVPVSLLAPSEPGSLAVGPDGVLYIADDHANAIFGRHPDGTFSVVAGTGLPGFSGDGSPATQAALNDPGGLTYDRATRTLYVADDGNNRIRAINAHGIIHTVVGGGPRSVTWVATGTIATQATLVDPGAVAISPYGALYIADSGASEVLRLNAYGTLTRVAGIRHHGGVTGVGGPALTASADGANGLAFDRHGDLYLTGFATKSLLAITPDGRIHEIWSQSLYPRGDGGIITAPNGTILVMGSQQVYEYSTLRHRHTLINFDKTGPINGIRAIAPNGIAITEHGTVYIDTDSNDGFTNAASIIQLTTHNPTPHVLWKR